MPFYMLLRHYKYKYGYEIHPSTDIAPGFYIGHFGGIVINQKATIGYNVNISQGVTIGSNNRGPKCGFPTIGNNVWIGPGAKIVGRITIGFSLKVRGFFKSGHLWRFFLNFSRVYRESEIKLFNILYATVLMLDSSFIFSNVYWILYVFISGAFIRYNFSRDPTYATIGWQMDIRTYRQLKIILLSDSQRYRMGGG